MKSFLFNKELLIIINFISSFLFLKIKLSIMGIILRIKFDNYIK